MKDINKFKL